MTGPRPTIPDELREAIVCVVATVPEIAAAYVFGSVARGEARADSDLDIGVLYTDRRAHDRLVASLASRLGAATGFHAVDVVDLEAQGPIFAHEVLCESVLVHDADPERRVDFESDTLVRAFDFRPTYDLATRGKAAALRRWLEQRYDV